MLFSFNVKHTCICLRLMKMKGVVSLKHRGRLGRFWTSLPVSWKRLLSLLWQCAVLPDWLLGLCPVAAQLVGLGYVAGGGWVSKASELEGGSIDNANTCLHYLPSSQRGQLKCRGGLNLKASTCTCSPAIGLFKDGCLQLVCRRVRFLEPSSTGITLRLEGVCLTHLGGGFVGLVFSLVSFHTSAIGLKLHGWKVVKCQKHGSQWEEGSIDITNTWWLGFYTWREASPAFKPGSRLAAQLMVGGGEGGGKGWR